MITLGAIVFGFLLIGFFIELATYRHKRKTEQRYKDYKNKFKKNA